MGLIVVIYAKGIYVGSRGLPAIFNDVTTRRLVPKTACPHLRTARFRTVQNVGLTVKGLKGLRGLRVAPRSLILCSMRTVGDEEGLSSLKPALSTEGTMAIYSVFASVRRDEKVCMLSTYA